MRLRNKHDLNSIWIGFLILVLIGCSTRETKKNKPEPKPTTQVRAAKDSVHIEKATENKNQVDSVITKLIDISNYKDFRYNDISEFDLLSGFSNIGGALIDENYDESYGLSIFNKGSTYLIVLELISMYDYKEKKYSPLSLLEIQGVSGDRTLTYYNCRKDSVPDNKIISLIEYGDKEYIDRVFKAWRIDLDSMSIIEIATNGIDCLNDDYGVW